MLFLCELIDTVEPFIMHVRRNLPFVSVSFIGTMSSRVLNFLDDDVGYPIFATSVSQTIRAIRALVAAESTDLHRNNGETTGGFIQQRDILPGN